MNASYGLPIVPGFYTKFCNYNYPATLPIKGTTDPSVKFDLDTGVVTYPIGYGEMSTK